MLRATSAVYVIKYMVKHEFGQTASCSFNITVYNGSGEFNFYGFQENLDDELNVIVNTVEAPLTLS